ncbi:GntR family transcriptional regulator [Marivita sp. GX14005]|uniref:GntR family transcriptional regulator n=1 Tax=Marivita sp. GX14005 TaxID=2942276 RepID=UPI0020185576|nr:GntR family transcriptional regulator [Marivita sp. GX14005]MCL3883114.1 GntR family transcriptional regulator [Marivita sp. GX14005]
MDRPKRRATRPEALLEKLRAAIEDGRLPPGARLPEEKLARALDASRARVREVLSLLANERLVELQTNRGAFVAKPTVEEARHICEARLMAERTTARLAAERATPDAVRKMREMVAEEQIAWDSDDVRNAVAKSRGFHRAIAEAAANPVLADILASLLSRSALTQAVYAARGAAGCLCHDHSALIDAIEAGDPDTAEAAMKTHMDNIISRLDLEPLAQEVDIEDALRDTL